MILLDLLLLYRRSLTLGITISISFMLIYIASFFVIYKRILKGKKNFMLCKLLTPASFIFYVTVLIGVVLLDRDGTYAFRLIGVQPFNLFREAWFNFSAIVWRNIILNIAAFIPLGGFMPILTKKLSRLWKVVGIGLFISINIEILQFITTRGQANIDDVICNVLGVLIGYCFVMFALTLKHKPDSIVKKSARYLIPFSATAFVFFTIFIIYDSQEFGNLSIDYYNKHNMSNVNITNSVDLSSGDINSYVYHTRSISKNQAQDFAEQFYRNLGSTIDYTKKTSYNNKRIFFYSNDNQVLSIAYIGKMYSYRGKPSDAISFTTSTEEQLREMLFTLGIDIPHNAEFMNHGDGRYTYKVDTYSVDQQYIGYLECFLLNDGSIGSIDSNLLEIDFSSEINIITPQDAYNKIAKGRFQYFSDNSAKLNSIAITDFALSYMLDSKGFYRPVYLFDAIVNDVECNIIISALAM